MAKKSRAKRYEEAVSLIEEAQSEFEILRDELQDWLANIPENLSEATKAEELQTTIDALDEIVSAAEEITGMDIEFPGMCG